MSDRQVMTSFLLWTFGIAYGVSGVLVLLANFGYTVYGWVDSPGKFLANIPFSIYILSPAISSYLVLKRAGRVIGIKQWLGHVFYLRNRAGLYAYVLAVLSMYFALHILVSGPSKQALPLYVLFLSLPGNLIIGGMEESGWVYVLQSTLQRATGYVWASILVSAFWVLWHVPLFFLPGTNHFAGTIDFWMFNVQLVAFRFLYGAIATISGRGYVFMAVFAHTVFNAASHTFGFPPTTWTGTLVANGAVLLVALATVSAYERGAVGTP